MNGEYRKGVGIFLLNKENKLWVGKRIDFKSNFWQMPQGGIDKNETPRQAMVRELGEEVGVTKNFKIIDETKNGWIINFPMSSNKECGMEDLLVKNKNGFYVNFWGWIKKLI
tara:strand:+ start:373 stop:708 length:336 start_codon:yes stop_codon:yes gene_type:complete